MSVTTGAVHKRLQAHPVAAFRGGHSSGFKVFVPAMGKCDFRTAAFN